MDRLLSVLGWPVTFVAVHFTWVFFRVPTFADGWRICAALVGQQSPAAPVSVRLYEVLGVLGTTALVLLEPWIVAVFRRCGVDWWWRVPFPLRGLAYASLVLAVTVFGGPTQKFIYFDF